MTSKSEQTKQAIVSKMSRKLQYKSDTGGFFSQKSQHSSKNDSKTFEVDEVLHKQKTDAYIDLEKNKEMEDASDMCSPKE